MQAWLRLTGLSAIILLLTACTPSPPKNVKNICDIFRQYPSWYKASHKTQQRWGVPIGTQMAIIMEESGFNAKIKPPREKLLWVIPWKRPTTAYGYAQSVNGTWSQYERSTGNYGAKRNDFKDASDFIGWYSHQAHVKAGVSINDPYALYLVYHEGIGGYEKGTYRQKAWLTNVARGVQYRANRYQQQLATCQDEFDEPWWHFW